MCGQVYKGNLHVHNNNPQVEQQRLRSMLIALVKAKANLGLLQVMYYAKNIMEPRTSDTALAATCLANYRAELGSL